MTKLYVEGEAVVLHPVKLTVDVEHGGLLLQLSARLHLVRRKAQSQLRPRGAISGR